MLDIENLQDCHNVWSAVLRTKILQKTDNEITFTVKYQKTTF